MPDRLVVDGSWPGKMSITRAWARAEARQWNDESTAGHLRLVRGGTDFLSEATALVSAHAGGLVYSPALYPTATRVWRKAGYRVFDHLLMMERSLLDPHLPPPRREVTTVSNPDWRTIAGIDDEAFEGFWRSGATGLAESAAATPNSVVMTSTEDGSIAGYVILGLERGTGYLQRIAVRPSMGGRGVGTDLLRAGLVRARAEGCRAVILNVRQEAAIARRLYQSQGFVLTPTRLELLRHEV